MKCKKDKAHATDQLCPVCSSPQHLSRKQITEQNDFQCTGPVISNSPGKDISQEEHLSELLSLEDFKSPFGNIMLNLTDEHGNTVDLSCQVVKPRESAEIMWNYTESLQISANLTFLFDFECPMDREKYTRLWRLLAYYSDVALYLSREIMLSKEPELSYRYRQDIERDAYYYTGVRANILSHPSWLMQPYVNIKLNRPYSTSKTVKLIFMTQMSFTTDSEQARQQKRSWVMIKQNNATQTTFSSVVGSMIEMDCSVVSSGAPTIQWMLPDGSKVRASFNSPNNRLSVSSTGKLLIKAVDHSDAGVYYCIAEVLGDVDLLSFRLSVAESSRPPVSEEVKIALEKFVGESVYLPCNTTASPDADVNWIFPDGSVMNAKANSSRGFIFSNGTLFIPHCRPDDNGNYKCVALNQHGEDTLSAKITVKRRQGTQPLRRYPMGPLSAAGVSTKVKAIFEDMEESSGDDTGQNRMSSNRGFVHQRRGPHSMSPAYPVRNLQRHFPGHRKPIKKGLNGQQRKGKRIKLNKSNNRVDPQRWADFLARIHEKAVPNTTTPSSYPSTPAEKVQTIDPEPLSNIEGSSPDDASSLKEEQNTIIIFHTNAQPVTAPSHIEYQTTPPETSIKSDKVTLRPVKTTATHNYVTTEINILQGNHVNTLTTSTSHREERQRNQLENNPAAPNSELENELGISVKFADVKESYTINEKDSTQWTNSTSTQTTKVISTNVIKERVPSTSYSRKPWNSRKRFGSRGRINRIRLRPSSSLITSRPQLFTAPKATGTHKPLITTTLSTTLTAGTSAYSTAPSITSTQYLKSATDNDCNGNDQTNVSLLVDNINILSHKLEAIPQHSTIQRTELTLNVPQHGLYHRIQLTTPAVTVTTSPRTANKETSVRSWQNVQTFTTETPNNYHTVSTSQPEADYKTLAVTQAEFTTQLSALKPSQEPVTEDDTAYTSPHISESHPEERLNSLQILETTHKPVKSSTNPVKLIQTSVIDPYEDTKTEDLQKKSFSHSTVKQGQAGFLTTTLHTLLNEHDSVFPITTPSPEVGQGELLLSNISNPSGIISTISTMASPTTKAKVKISTKPLTTTSTPMTPSIKTTESAINSPILTTIFGETTSLKPSVPIADNRIPVYSRNPSTNHIPDGNHGRTLDYKHPNHRHLFIIHQTSSDTNLSVNNVRAGSDGTVRSSLSPKSFTTTIQRTTTTPTAKPLSRIQTGVVATNQHLGMNLLLPQLPDVPVLRARPRITTANLTTVTVNAETDVQFPCNSVGEPKPFLTWTKVSTGTNTNISNTNFFESNNKYKQIHRLIFKLPSWVSSNC